jgi:hypothetical protein
VVVLVVVVVVVVCKPILVFSFNFGQAEQQARFRRHQDLCILHNALFLSHTGKNIMLNPNDGIAN